MAEYAGDFENGSYAGQGSGSFNRSGNATIVDGGNNQFVVEYRYGAEADIVQGGTDVQMNGGNSQFVIRVDGSAGGSDIVIDGGNNRFVVVFDNATGGDNTVTVKGGNNQFVVAFDYADGSAAGDMITVEGGNNSYVIAYDYTGIGGETGFAGASGGGPVAAMGGAMGGGNPFGGMGGSYVYDFSAFGQPMAGGGPGAPSAGGNPFASLAGGGNPFAGGAGGGNPFAGGAGGGNPFAGDATGDEAGAEDGSGDAAGGAGGGDLASLLRQSPFGRLAEIEGGLEGFVAALATRSAADEAAGVANPFGNVAPGTNPFESLGQGGGNPFAGGGGDAPPADSAMENGGNPFAGPDGASFFGPPGQSADPDYVYDFAEFDEGGSIEDALADSPFGPLLELPGYTVEDLLSALDGTPVYSQDIV